MSLGTIRAGRPLGLPWVILDPSSQAAASDVLDRAVRCPIGVAGRAPEEGLGCVPMVSAMYLAWASSDADDSRRCSGERALPESMSRARKADITADATGICAMHCVYPTVYSIKSNAAFPGGGPPTELVTAPAPLSRRMTRLSPTSSVTSGSKAAAQCSMSVLRYIACRRKVVLRGRTMHGEQPVSLTKE